MNRVLSWLFPACEHCDERSIRSVVRCPFCHRHPDYTYPDEVDE